MTGAQQAGRSPLGGSAGVFAVTHVPLPRLVEGRSGNGHMAAAASVITEAGNALRFRG